MKLELTDSTYNPKFVYNVQCSIGHYFVLIEYFGFFASERWFYDFFAFDFIERFEYSIYQLDGSELKTKPEYFYQFHANSIEFHL